MLRRFVMSACALCAACRGDHEVSSSAPTPGGSRCPTADELVHGRKIGASTQAAYVITAGRCIADNWSERVIGCLRDASNFDDEDRCLDLLTPSQSASLAKALGELAAQDDKLMKQTVDKVLDEKRSGGEAPQ